jgi:glycosyltransferase involved in cell wall biosynthesis
MKRVLIVSYFFPPVSNMGSHRILRFVRHLREFGWEPVVLTGKSAGWTTTDEHLLRQIPTDIEVLRVGGFDLTEIWQKLRGGGGGQDSVGATPSRSQGLTTFLNRWVMIPDKYFPWIRPATQAGAAVKNIAAIYSTSDPLSDHLVARRIARRTGVPYVAEFRDLWLGSPYFARAHPTSVHRAWHARLERRVVTEAASIVGLSRGIADYFALNYSKPAEVIYNCFDPGEYGPTAGSDSVFTVVYAGALYSSRSPEPFLAGFAEFVKHHPSARFAVVGGSPDLDLPAMVARLGLGGHVELVGRVPHAEALRRMQDASVLLAVQSPEDDVHVPGKLFEYIGARRPILAVSRPCEVAELITRHQLGWVAKPETGDIAAKLTEAHAAWQTRGHDGLALTAADRFGTRARTRQLAELLEKVSAKP